MSALVVEYQRMQRELFEIVERFVVLNETAYRMLVADGSPKDKLADQSPRTQPERRHAEAGARRSADEEARCISGSPGGSIRRRASSQIVRAALAIPRRRGFPDRHPRAGARRGRARDRRGAASASPATIRAIHFEPAVSSAEIPAVLTELDALLSPSLLVRKRADDRARGDGRRHADHRDPRRQSGGDDRGRRERPARRSGQRPASCRRRCSKRRPTLRRRSTSGAARLPPVRTHGRHRARLHDDVRGMSAIVARG